MLLAEIVIPAFLCFRHASAQLIDPADPIALLSNDSSFQFDIVNALGLAAGGGGDIAPILSAARNITPGDFNSFSQVFYELANDTKALAQDPSLAYDKVNVRDTWFSAATYFRLADFYLHGDPKDPLINILWKEQTAAFDKAMAALPVPGQRVKIPSNNFTVEAIWWPVAVDQVKRPTIILGNGYDGSQEDLYHSFVSAAHQRGWNAITYEGPGQPTVRRYQDLGFIPDWERVVTPVVDYILANQTSAVDSSKLLLFGYSFGGYLAARAAAYEKRIKAVILDGGVFDAYQAFHDQLPIEAQDLLDAGNASAFNALIEPAINSPGSPTQLRWGAQQGMWSFNVDTPFDFLERAKAFHVSGFIDRLSVPVFVADASLEGFFAGQSIKVAEALGNHSTYHLFGGFSGYHCQIGSLQDLNRVMWAWVNKHFG